MATLSMGLQQGEVVDSSSSLSSTNGCSWNSSEPKSSSPILIILVFNKAMCNELDVLHQLAMGDAVGQHADIGAFLERFQFLRSVYENYLNAKDEVIFAAVDARVKNVAPTYVLQHNFERTLFDNLVKLLLISGLQNKESFQRELASFTGALQTVVSQCMAKEEEQVIPLLTRKFSLEEQASLVWKLLCSIPTNIVAKLLPWLSSSISPDEYQDLCKCLRKIIPEEKLLQQVIFTWMEEKDSCATMKAHHQTGETSSASGFIGAHPIDDVLLWHNAIKRELNEVLEEAKKIHISGAVSYDLSAFYDKLQFISEICIFHSVAEEKIIYPAVYGEISFFQEHSKEKSLCNEFRGLIESIQKSGTISSSSAEFHVKICLHANQIMETITRHFYAEETQVLPFVRKHFSIKRQQELLHQSLCVMPLKLIECALPWLVNSLTANEAKNFVKNMQLAATASDAALVRLFCGWASNGRSEFLCLSAIGCCPIKMFSNGEEEFGQSSCACASVLHTADIYSTPCQESSASDPSKTVTVQKVYCSHGSCSSLRFNSYSVCETYNSFSATGLAEQPIDVVFKVHKVIRRDLEYLDNESERLINCDEIFLEQFTGSFSLFWGLYRAHSNAEDSIVYPALESRDALHNVSDSYTLDHKQEEKAFENISGVLFELSQLHGSLQRVKMSEKLTGSTIRFSGADGNDCVGKYYELATKLQVMFKSLRMMVDQHMSREELELWPLFGMHFSVEEQNKMVGFILGTTSAEVLRSMLPWVTSALSEEERTKMMDTFKQVTKNTMFNEWLSECWKGTSLSTSTLTRKMETRISPKGAQFQGSLHRIDHMLNSRRKNKLKKVMTSYWMAAQQRSPQAIRVDISDGKNFVGRSPTFRDPEKKVYGCKHYKRNCKLLAACCGKLFTCRFCHDSMSDHPMDKKSTSEMMCMRCLNIQPVGQICSTPSCNGFPMAKYYCNPCNIFDDERHVYHCPFCNLCRVGKGLGVDYFHCMSCNCCLSMSSMKHKCQEKCLETNCPICNEFLFTSSSTIRALSCGHYMHIACLEACNPTQSHFICPVCSKSSGDMTMASNQSPLLVRGDETMEFYNCDQGTQMKTSWTDASPEGRFFGRARSWVTMLDHFVSWFEPNIGDEHQSVVVPRSLQRLKKRLENGVAGQKAKDRGMLCGLVLCILVLFCVLSTVVILVWFKALGINKYLYGLYLW